jgi:hypothetical protein
MCICNTGTNKEVILNTHSASKYAFIDTSIETLQTCTHEIHVDISYHNIVIFLNWGRGKPLLIKVTLIVMTIYNCLREDLNSIPRDYKRLNSYNFSWRYILQQLRS